MPRIKRRKIKTTGQPSAKQISVKRNPKKEKTSFVRHVFEQYFKVEKFHFNWFHLDICTNINNNFFIDDAISVTEKDLMNLVLRQQAMQLALSQGLQSTNNYNVYRADYYVHNQIYIYQTTPNDCLPRNLVQDYSNVVLLV